MKPKLTQHKKGMLSAKISFYFVYISVIDIVCIQLITSISIFVIQLSISGNSKQKLYVKVLSTDYECAGQKGVRYANFDHNSTKNNYPDFSGV